MEQNALFAVDVGDRALAARGRGVARVVGEHRRVGVELADVDDVRTDRPLEHREVEASIGDVQGCALVGHDFGSTIWSAMRLRLSPLPSKTSTSKIPGDTVRPVSAARSGWASLPSFTSRASATDRISWSVESWVHVSSPASASWQAARRARASEVSS